MLFTTAQAATVKAYILNPANGLSGFTSGPGTDYAAIAAASNFCRSIMLFLKNGSTRITLIFAN